MASSPPDGPRRSRTASGQFDRRTLWLSALLLGGVLVIGVVVVAATVSDGPRRDTQNQLAEDGGAKPHIIPRPDDGHAPSDAGDRGGWEQLALMGLMTVAVVGIGLVIFRGGRKARENRAAWREAGRSGVDGALENRTEPEPTASSPPGP